MDSTPTSSQILSVCIPHNEIKNMFCKECKVMECSNCMVEDHLGHRFCAFNDAAYLAITNNERLNADYKTTIQSVKKAIETIKSTSTNVDVRAVEIREEVHLAFTRYKSDLEKRKRDLLLEVDEMKQRKVGILLKQMETLNPILSQLTESSELLTTTSLHLDKTSEITLVNQEAERILQQISSDQLKLTPAENNNFSIVYSQDNLLRSLTANSRIDKECDPSINIITKLNKRFDPVISFECKSNDEQKLYSPGGICVDRIGYINSDVHNHQIRVFSTTGNFLYKFGSRGRAPGQFLNPNGLAKNPQGNLVIADSDNHRIQIFQIDGTFLSTFGEYGTKNGQFNRPMDVACNSMGHIVVADTKNDRIQMFTGDGEYLYKLEFESNGLPKGITFAPNGNVIVTDSANNRFAIIDSQFKEVRFFGTRGTVKEEYNNPMGVCCDNDGNLIISDHHNHRVQMLTRDGDSYKYLYEVGEKGDGIGELGGPSYVCVNPEGRVIVVEWNNKRVQMF